ncbi:MAG: alpha/beta hydrolase [Gaiellales bacterium]
MTTLAVSEWGDPTGAPVVCLHGVTGHRNRFAALAARLPQHRVIGVDLLGHGDSSRLPPWGLDAHLASLVATADSLGLERATWVGHSFGGRLVAELVARRGERVSAAVLLDPALSLEPEITAPRAEGLCADLSFPSPDAAIDARLTDGSLLSTPRSTVEDEAAAHLAQRDDGRWEWRYSRPAVICAWSIMSTPGAGVPTSVPTLVVLGRESWIEPPPMPKLATLTVVAVPGGHSVLWDAFEPTSAAIAEFLGSR